MRLFVLASALPHIVAFATMLDERMTYSVRHWLEQSSNELEQRNFDAQCCSSRQNSTESVPYWISVITNEPFCGVLYRRVVRLPPRPDTTVDQGAM